MYKYIFNLKKPTLSLIFHILLGVISTIVNFGLILWFYYILILLTKELLMPKMNVNKLLILMIYIVSMEVIGRMAKCSPIIPWEASKYILFVVGILLFKKSKIEINNIAVFMLLFVAVSILVSNFYFKTIFEDLVFNLFGILTVALGIFHFAKYQSSEVQINKILWLVWLSCISVLTYITITSPDLSDVEFKLGANFQTTGGFGSNQVSTIMGIGFFLSGYAWYKKLKFSGNRTFDGFVLGAFALRGLLTFSRGGILVGVLAFFVYFVLQILENNGNRARSIFIILILGSIGVFGFKYADNLTGGNLSLRYQGKTEGTIADNQDVTLNKLTTGRYDILLGDFDLFLNNPFLGVGIGNSADLRETMHGVVSHVEFSRLLAEQGIMGFLTILFLLISVINSILRNHYQRGLVFAFFVIGIGTTFHAGMRTYVTPVFVILGSLQIVPNTKKIKANSSTNAV